nr:MAG TPA: portal protein [Caudoviricetes sp.]
MTIEEILNSTELTAAEKITALREKTIQVPVWTGRYGLVHQFDPTKHPVMNEQKYPDIVSDDGIEYVTRVTCDLQRLATKRMTELCCGIPVKRVYKPENDTQKMIASYIEAIFDRNRINSVNIERLNMLFAGCEVLTLWYAIESNNNIYGFDSPLKFRCRNFSPMLGDDLYPLFDEYGDMVAMSVGYTRKIGKKNVQYFDTYTEAKHIKYSDAGGEWAEIENEDITAVGKIPCIYMCRPTPIWEDTSKTVYEIEWALSRNGNYLRKNSKPIFVVLADEVIQFGDEKPENKEFKAVMQYPKGSTAQYVTWQQAIENLKFYVNELRSLFFTQLQLPDWSYEKMSQQALSGESRKQLFIDAQMKVNDESGRLLEGFDREINVVKAFLKTALPERYHSDIDALKVETKITPFSITDTKETVDMLMTANGGEPIMSQRESIEEFGHSDDVDKTLEEIAQQGVEDAFNPTV